MDDRRTGETEWFESLLDDTQQRLQDQISCLADLAILAVGRV